MSAISGRTVGVALGIDLAIGVASLSIFSILRIISPTNRYYNPRIFYGASSTARTSSSTQPVQAPLAAAALKVHNAASNCSEDEAAGPQQQQAQAVPASTVTTTTNGSSSSSRAYHKALAVQEDSIDYGEDLDTNAATCRTPSLLFPASSPLAPPGEQGMPLPGAPLPPVLPNTLLTWLVPLLRLSEPRVIAAVGLDVAMLLRFIRFALKLLLLLMIWCMGVVLPVNYTGGNLLDLAANQAVANATHTPGALAALTGAPQPAASPPPSNGFLGSLLPSIPANITEGVFANFPGKSASSVGNGTNDQRVRLGAGDPTNLARAISEGRYVHSDLDLLSMANIASGSRLLWVHLASVYVVTAVTLKLLWSATSDALRVYLAHLSSSSMNLDSASHTALLTDIPGMPRGTLIDKVLHNPLFWLLPAGVRRRIKAGWFQMFRMQPVLTAASKKHHTQAAAAVAEAVEMGDNDDDVTGGSDHDGDLANLGQPRGAAAGSSSGPGQQSLSAHPTVAAAAAAQLVGTATATAAAAASDGDVRLSVPAAVSVIVPPAASDCAAHHDQAAADGTRETQLQHSTHDNGLRHRVQFRPHKQQQQQQQQPEARGEGGVALQLPSDTALAAAVAAQAQRGAVQAGVGGIGMFSDEWRRAAQQLSSGLAIEEFVLREFQAVYGAENVVAVHIVNHTAKAARLVQQYNLTHMQLEDLLDHYSLQLHAAAAAAGRQRKRRAAAGCFAAACGVFKGRPGRRVARHGAMEAIDIKTLPWPKEPKQHTKHSSSSSSNADKAPSQNFSADASSAHTGVSGTGSSSNSKASGRTAAAAAVIPDSAVVVPMAAAVAEASLGSESNVAAAATAAAAANNARACETGYGAVAAEQQQQYPEQQQQRQQQYPEQQQQSPLERVQSHQINFSASPSEASLPPHSDFSVPLSSTSVQQQQQQQLLARLHSHRINFSAPPSEVSVAPSSTTAPAGSTIPPTQGSTTHLQRVESHHIDFADDSSIASSSMWGGSVPASYSSQIGNSYTQAPGTSAAICSSSSSPGATAAAAAIAARSSVVSNRLQAAEQEAAAAVEGSSSVMLRSRLARVTSGDTDPSRDSSNNAAAAAAAAGSGTTAATTDLGKLCNGHNQLPLVLISNPANNESSSSGNKQRPYTSSSSNSKGAGNNKGGSSSSSSTTHHGTAPRRCFCLPAPPSGDACEVLLHRLGELHQQLQQAQQQAAEDPLPAAFVTFRTRAALTAAISSHHVAEAGVWKLTAAPPPDSLNWSKLGLRYWELGLRRGLTTAVLILLALTYVVPVAFVQGILQLDRLQGLPVIGTLVSLPVVQSLLLGVLPGLALRIFVLLLPVILYALDRRAGPKGAAQLDGWVATQFFGLQVIIVFFASFITGSLFNQLNVLFTQGLEPVLDRLGTGAPQTANFFILYIVFTAFIGRSLALLRPWGLFMSSMRALTARNKGRTGRRRAVLVGTYRMFGPSVPEHSMILLLGLIFSVIAPLVLAAAFVFFCMAIVVESYNWVWVFRRPYEGGGRLWKQLFRHVFVALYLFQLVMVALLIVKRFVWVVLLLPLFLITMLVHHVGSKLLQHSWDALSMRAARELDLQDRQEAQQALEFWREVGIGQRRLQEAPQRSLSKVHSKPELFSEAAAAAAAAKTSFSHNSSNASSSGGGSAGTAVDDAQVVEEVCASQTEVWANMYRPPAVQLLEVAPELHDQLAQRVADMQARLAAHNAAAKLEAAMARAAREAAARV